MFAKSTKITGVQIKGFSDEEIKHLIIIADEDKKIKKGMLDNIIGKNDDMKHESAITLKKTTEIVRKITNIPDNESINIYLYTLGGDAMACDILTKAILNHSGKIRVFIPEYAFSAGTMIALASDEIYMSKNSVLGPMDPQLQGLPVNSILDSIKNNEDSKPSYIASFMKSFASKAQDDYNHVLEKILKTKFGDKYNTQILESFTQTHHHGYPIDVRELRNMGLEIRDLKVNWRDTTNVLECDLEVDKDSILDDSEEEKESEN